ncbi:MAG TPA: CapA family protein [Melioribacteraceae bacterium]|nr:CapA family protein [Melioribacteraceae bacterium]
MHIIIKKITILKLLPFIFFISSNKYINNEEIKKTDYATIIFVGDLMCHGPQIESARVKEYPDSFNFFDTYRYVKNFISSANIAIGNLETVIGGKELGYSGFPTFNSPIDYLKGIKNAGFNFLITSNNHSYDKGKKGLLHTIDELNKFKIPYTGTYKSKADRDSIRIVNVNNIKIAILSYTYGLNGYKLPKGEEYLTNLIDTSIINKDISKSKNMGVDIILTYF